MQFSFFLQLIMHLLQHVQLGSRKSAVTGAFGRKFLILVVTVEGFGLNQFQLADSLGKGVFAACHRVRLAEFLFVRLHIVLLNVLQKE